MPPGVRPNGTDSTLHTALRGGSTSLASTPSMTLGYEGTAWSRRWIPAISGGMSERMVGVPLWGGGGWGLGAGLWLWWRGVAGENGPGFLASCQAMGTLGRSIRRSIGRSQREASRRGGPLALRVLGPRLHDFGPLSGRGASPRD